MCFVEPQISHFANFTSCEELLPILHFWKMWNLHMVNFDNFGGLTSVLCSNFTSFSFLTVKNWYAFVPSAKDWFDFSQMWRIGTQFSQMWRIGTSSSHLNYPLKLTKFEAPSCNGFWDIKFSMSKFAKGNNSKKIKWFLFLIFHQIIYSLFTISWPSLKLLAVIVYEVSC